MKIYNPILTGFNPDPSMIFVDGYYYIATSTFEYYPGVQIHKSSDMLNWQVVARPVDMSNVNMVGNMRGAGIWAPCLSYSDGVFYLIYTDVKSYCDGPFKDCNNYLITATDIEGQWSKPSYLCSVGFDASLFHDTDGKKYYVSANWNHLKEPDRNKFDGIFMQEFDPATNSLVGERQIIFYGTDRALIEAPHIYKVGEYYYIFVAEGGTHVEHAETVGRSKNIAGPYELHPDKYLITALDTDCTLQKAGHASMCCNDKGQWYLAHLCGRMVVNGNCTLGRETAIQNLEWKDNRPYVVGGNKPRDYFEVDGKFTKQAKPTSIKFDDKSMRLEWQSLRSSIDDKVVSRTDNEIVLRGTGSPTNKFEQSLLAIRQDAFQFTAQVDVDFNPTKLHHFGGMVYRYAEDLQYLALVTYDNDNNCRAITTYTFDQWQFSHTECIPVEGPVTIKLDVDYAQGQFSYSTNGVDFIKLGNQLDASKLSDDYGNNLGFTGAFVGFMVSDLQEHKQTCKFSNFVYSPKN